MERITIRSLKDSMKYLFLLASFCFVFQLASQEYEEVDFQIEGESKLNSRTNQSLIEYDGIKSVQKRSTSGYDEQRTIEGLNFNIFPDDNKGNNGIREEYNEGQIDKSKVPTENGGTPDDPTPPPPSTPDLPINTHLGILAFIMITVGVYNFRKKQC